MDAFSWLAVKDIAADIVLERAGLQTTATYHDDDRVTYCFACLSTGWTILFAQDFDFACDARLAEMSRLEVTVVGCQVDEDALYSRSACFIDGRPVWQIVHDSSRGPRHLETDGVLPDGFYEIRSRLEAEQTQNDAGDADSDFIFDIPVEVAALGSGYRYNRSDYDGDPPVFTDAEPIGGYVEDRLQEPWWRRNPFGD